MIRIVDKISCCGCNACGDICAHNAIDFKIDKEGFWYPEVDTTKCVDCGLCEKVCPMLHKNHKMVSPQVFGAYSNDETIRLESASGGIFSELASTAFNDGWVVSGAIYNADHSVSHIVTPDATLLPQIRCSKYLQSDVQGIYKQIASELKAGHKVLFCGTPCQVHALKNFVGEKRQENLTTIDLFCHGVNSPKVWLKYMEMLEKQFGSKAVKIKMRAKKLGWHRFSMQINFENGKEYCLDKSKDLFLYGFLRAGNFCRLSCYECQFKGFPQAADLTLADFWGIEKIDPSMDQDKGTSFVVVNTEKGAQLFDAIKCKIVYKQYSAEVLANRKDANNSLVARVDNRDEFFEALDKLPFDQVAKEFFPKRKTAKKVSIIRKAWQKMKKACRLVTEKLFHM